MSSRKILVVDDDRQARSLYKRILWDEAEIEVAATGEAALELVETFRPDLILLDVMLPGIDGYEVCRRIRGNPRFKMIKIVLVSGRTTLPERIEGYDAGADDYLTKPCENDELKAKIDVFMRLKRTEEIDSLKSDLLTLFEHETKTPIAGILGMVEILLDDPSLEANARMCVDLIRKNSLEMREFTKKTTLLCRLKRGMVLDKVEGDPAEHLRAVVDRYSRLAEEQGVTFEIGIEPGLELRADWALVDPCFEYLIDNAVKFSPANGIVWLHVGMDEGYLVVKVVDEGEGLPTAWFTEVFDEFAVRDLKHRKKGQGLSLAIVRHVANHHGGRVWAESAPGQGSTFGFVLPVGDERETVPVL